MSKQVEEMFGRQWAFFRTPEIMLTLFSSHYETQEQCIIASLLAFPLDFKKVFTTLVE